MSHFKTNLRYEQNSKKKKQRKHIEKLLPRNKSFIYCIGSQCATKCTILKQTIIVIIYVENKCMYCDNSQTVLVHGERFFYSKIEYVIYFRIRWFENLQFSMNFYGFFSPQNAFFHN